MKSLTASAQTDKSESWGEKSSVSLSKVADVFRGNSLADCKLRAGEDVGDKRRRASKYQKNDKRRIHKLFLKHDISFTGSLNREELKALLVELDSDRLNSRLGSVEEQDVDNLMKLCDRAQNGVIDLDEVETAVMMWQQYLKVAPKIDSIFKKYDTDQSGRLDQQQLKRLLVDLNEGCPVEDSEVQFILKEADKLGDGQISRIEMDFALSVWYHRVEGDETAGGVPVENARKVYQHCLQRTRSKKNMIGPSRQKEQVRWESDSGKIEALFDLYDKNKSGALEHDQLKALMVDIVKVLGQDQATASLMDPTAVEGQDVRDLMRMCDQAKSGVINRNEVLFAVELWQKHSRLWPQIRDKFAKYDTDETGRLDVKQLKNLLIDLNDGVPIEDRDARWVLENADLLGDGYIGKLEVAHAISLWYLEVDRRELNSVCCGIQ